MRRREGLRPARLRLPSSSRPFVVSAEQVRSRRLRRRLCGRYANRYDVFPLECAAGQLLRAVMRRFLHAVETSPTMVKSTVSAGGANDRPQRAQLTVHRKPISRAARSHAEPARPCPFFITTTISSSQSSYHCQLPAIFLNALEPTPSAFARRLRASLRPQALSPV